MWLHNSLFRINGCVDMSKRGKRRARAQARENTGGSNDSASIADPTPRKSHDPSISLFHYTTASGLIGIVSSNSLWATHARFLNDTAECQLLSHQLIPQIESEFRALLPKLMERGAFTPDVMELAKGNGLRHESERATTAIQNAIDGASPIHITSFCRHRADSAECEHGLLSQWRGYAQGGFAIEFDERELDDLIDEEYARHSYQVLISRRVEYENHEKAAGRENFVGLGAACLRAAFELKSPKLATKPEIKKLLGNRDMTEFIRPFIHVVPFLKSPRFSEENEYRVVALPTRTQAQIDDARDARSWKEIHFREGYGGAIVPYIKLFDNLNKRLPIKRVIVGPHRDQDNQLLAAKMVLQRHGFDVPMVRSDTSLRP